jgi:hypothetical protein
MRKPSPAVVSMTRRGALEAIDESMRAPFNNAQRYSRLCVAAMPSTPTGFNWR